MSFITLQRYEKNLKRQEFRLNFLKRILSRIDAYIKELCQIQIVSRVSPKAISISPNRNSNTPKEIFVTPKVIPG
jgi:hypothetical protein